MDEFTGFPPGGPHTPDIEENPRPALTREQLVAAMNEKYCWLDDEKGSSTSNISSPEKKSKSMPTWHACLLLRLMAAREKPSPRVRHG